VLKGRDRLIMKNLEVGRSSFPGLEGFDFGSRRMRYRASSNRENGGAKEKELLPQMDHIRAPRREDILKILKWVDNPEVSKHLAPAPRVPADWDDEKQVKLAVNNYADYLNNKGDRGKIMPALAVNFKDEPLAIAIVRWRGDPYVPKDERIASIEGLIVDPEIQGHKIGTEFISTLIKFIFDGYKGYLGSRGAKEIRAWVMTDDIAKPWVRNLGFFTRLGFQEIPDHKPWQTFAAERHIDLADEEKGRGDARWLQLTPELFQRAEADNNSVKVNSHLDLSLVTSDPI
jgi:GNAT superfamily N-acetyltransferase